MLFLFVKITMNYNAIIFAITNIVKCFSKYSRISINLVIKVANKNIRRCAYCFETPIVVKLLLLIREAAKKSSFQSSPATKAFSPPPSA